MRLAKYLAILLGVVGCLAAGAVEFVRGDFCPFCSAVNMTFSEQIKSNDVVVIARLVELPKPVTNVDDELPKAELEIVRIFKGDRFVEPAMRFQTLLVGTYEKGQEFLVMGVDPPLLVWSTPVKSSPRMIEYLEKIQLLPASGPERLVFFQQYFEDSESALAFDAYDEFAVANYADLIGMKDQMDRAKLLEYIQNSEVPTNRRRLYFTMLGVCGQPDDVPVLEKLLTAEDRNQRAGLDALVACYLCLKGADGLELIEKEFLANDEVDFVDTLAAVSAVRFHGTEAALIPRERLVASIRLILDRPKLADMVIPDLARWEDWTVVDRLVTMFKEADPKNNWLRVPIIQYLMACPKPEAKKYLDELRQLDPEAVRRASFFSDFGFGDGQQSPTSTPVPGAKRNPDGEVQVVRRPPVSEEALDIGELDARDVDQPSGEPSEETPDQQSAQTGSEPNRTEPNSRVNVEQVGSLRLGSPSGGRSMALEPVSPRVDLPNPSQGSNPAPTEADSALPQPRFWWALIPVAVSGVMFVLLWSVINGWFVRLLY